MLCIYIANRIGKQALSLYAPTVPPLLPLLCFNNPPFSPCLRVTLLQTLNTSGKPYHSKILKTLISQSAVGRLEETFRVSLVVEEKPLYLRSSCIFLLGKSYL